MMLRIPRKDEQLMSTCQVTTSALSFTSNWNPPWPDTSVVYCGTVDSRNQVSCYQLEEPPRVTSPHHMWILLTFIRARRAHHWQVWTIPFPGPAELTILTLL